MSVSKKVLWMVKKSCRYCCFSVGIDKYHARLDGKRGQCRGPEDGQ